MEYELVAIDAPFPRPFPTGYEGGQFDLTSNGAELVCGFNDISPADDWNFRTSPYQIGFVELTGVVMVLAKIGGFAIDAPYSPHIGEDYEPEYIEEGKGLILSALLIDSSTKIVKSMRVLTLSNKFSKRLNQVYEKYRAEPFDYEIYKKQVSEINKRYPSTLTLWQYAKDQCKGPGTSLK